MNRIKLLGRLMELKYTKEQQMGAAVLLKKESGKPDGFLLGVFDAGALNEVLDISSIENTVNTFAV
ncbi:MAG: hypothetical protein K6E91_14630 [Butyrivibrio sp.]|nr:hypothetical protein [Butyrivibrio sp.]